jgi:hypothetical protein
MAAAGAPRTTFVDFALARGEVAVDGHGACDVRGVHGIFAGGVDEENCRRPA